MTAPKDPTREALPDEARQWHWVKFEGLNGVTDWMPARKDADGKYWESVGWCGVTPVEIGAALLRPHPHWPFPTSRLTDALSALESERQAHAAEVEGLRADAERLDWMDKNPGRIKHSTGYRGAPDSWVWTDANGYGHDAANLRAAIDQAIAKEKT